MPHADLPVAGHGVVILIDPPSYHYFENRFFDLTTPLNRDQTLRPNAEMKARLEAAGYPVFTADMLESVRPHYSDCRFDYWSLGAPAAQALAFSGENVRKQGVALFEPPLVKPDDYRNVERLAGDFAHVFLHNTEEDGYRCVDPALRKKLRRLDWTNRNYLSTPNETPDSRRINRVALIAGAHFRRAAADNGYGIRLAAINDRGLGGPLDLFGRGWGRLQPRSPLRSAWWALKLRRHAMAVGAPESKTEIYSSYDFAFCVENMRMSGYITEKIFDALFCGCIPIYWGAPDIKSFISADCFVDMDEFGGPAGAIDQCVAMTPEDRTAYRQAIRRFLASSAFERFNGGFHATLEQVYKVSDQ